MSEPGRMHAREGASGLRSVVDVGDATSELTLPALETLLVEARAINQANGITGVLLFNDGSIMQCFEGPEEAIRATYARIRASRRHQHLVELMNEPVAARSFEGWSMGLARPAGSDLLKLSTARWTATAKLTGTAAVSPGLELLQVFWQNARR